MIYFGKYIKIINVFSVYLGNVAVPYYYMNQELTKSVRKLFVDVVSANC